jgi:hypothetical protein
VVIRINNSGPRQNDREFIPPGATGFPALCRRAPHLEPHVKNACPVCGKVYQVSPEHTGRKILCKQCGNKLVVSAAGLELIPPTPASPPAPPPPPPPPPPQYAAYPAATAPTALTPNYYPPPAAPSYPYPAPQVPPPAPMLDLDSEPDPQPPVHRRRRPGGDALTDFLTFRLMLTPVLIQIVFWLGTLGCIGMGVIMALGFQGHVTATSVALGAATALFGPLVLRVYCEIALILFRIHDELKEQNDRTRRG